MTQQEILDNMTGGEWQSIDILNVNGCNIGHIKPYDEEACLLAVNATFGSGILPEEVEEMRQLLDQCLYWDDQARDHVFPKIHNLFSRINSRKK